MLKKVLFLLQKIIFLYIFLSLFCLKYSHAEEFTKSENNPTIINQNYPNWTEVSQRQPFVLFDSNKYKLWYNSDNGSKFKIAYAESNNLNSWNGIQLLNLDNNVDNQDPFVIKSENNYSLYHSSSVNGGDYKIHKIDSTDGINFDPINDKVIITPSDSWENKAVSSPFVINLNSKYYLFYSGWSGSIWKIGLATSDDGINWTKCLNNPIVTSGSSGPYLIQENNKLLLFFHNQTANKISYIESSDELSCNTNWSSPIDLLSTDKPYDNAHLTDPSLFVKNDTIYLFYSGQNLQNIWTINYAFKKRQEKYPIIFIPGIMTTWNKNAILYNLTVEQKDWKVLDFIKEYDGILKTFENLGYVKNKDYYVFTYDWRKNIDNAINQLNTFIQENILNNNPDSKINIVGHSLGGLIGRLYAQSNPDLINKIITVGSPNNGSPSLYKAVQAGEIEKSNNLLYIAQNLILSLYRDKYLTNKETVWNEFPILLNIYPTYNFIYDDQNSLISYDKYNIKNDYLISKNLNIDSVLSNLASIYGSKGNTIFGYKTKKRTLMDAMLDNYIDGVPIEYKYQKGDLNIPLKSAVIGNNNIEFNLDHEELIFKEDSIKQILKSLNINYSNENITEGERTVLQPSILLIMMSPARMKVSYNDIIFEEKDGLIFVSNANYGIYKINVIGEEKGPYSILIGLTNENNSNWFEIKGEIRAEIPSSQRDEYLIKYNEKNNNSFPVIDKKNVLIFKQLTNTLKSIQTEENLDSIKNIIKKINIAKKQYNSKKFLKLRLSLLNIHKLIFNLYKTPQPIYFKNTLFSCISILENIYIKTLTNKNISIDRTILLAEYKKLLEETKLTQNFLHKMYLNNIDVSYETDILSKTNIKLKKIKNDINKNNLIRAEIYLKTVKQSLFFISKKKYTS